MAIQRVTRVFLRTYSTLVMFWDLLCAVIGCSAAIFESILHTISPPVLKSIAGETALVIGSTRGVGRELALQLSALGARVVCWDIDIERNPTADALPRPPPTPQRGTVFFYACDVSDRQGVLAAAARVQREVGEVTMILHCCGLPSPRVITEQETPGVEHTFGKTVLSHFWVMEAFLPRMLDRNHGHIVAMTSVAGLTGIRNQVPLCASQFAVQGIMESLREELRALKATGVNTTLVHIYPFVAGDPQRASDLRMRIPSYFGTIEAQDAATKILAGVRRNCAELSVPSYLLFLGHLVRMLPRKASDMLRQLFDTGVDFC